MMFLGSQVIYRHRAKKNEINIEYKNLYRDFKNNNSNKNDLNMRQKYLLHTNEYSKPLKFIKKLLASLSQGEIGRKENKSIDRRLSLHRRKRVKIIKNG